MSHLSGDDARLVEALEHFTIELLDVGGADVRGAAGDQPVLDVVERRDDVLDLSIEVLLRRWRGGGTSSDDRRNFGFAERVSLDRRRRLRPASEEYLVHLLGDGGLEECQ